MTTYPAHEHLAHVSLTLDEWPRDGEGNLAQSAEFSAPTSWADVCEWFEGLDDHERQAALGELVTAEDLEELFDWPAVSSSDLAAEIEARFFTSPTERHTIVQSLERVLTAIRKGEE